MAWGGYTPPRRARRGVAGRRHRRVRLRGGDRSAEASTPPPIAADREQATRSAARSTSATEGRPTVSPSRRPVPVVTGSRPTARPSTCGSSPSGASRAGLRSAGGRSRSTRSSTARITCWRSTGSPIACRRDDRGVVRAPAPALVVAVTVAPGDQVEAGSPVAVLEAMKMEMTVVATHAGRVLEVLVAGSTHVDAGAPLVSVEPRVLDGAPAPPRPRGSASVRQPRHRTPEHTFARAGISTRCAA